MGLKLKIVGKRGSQTNASFPVEPQNNNMMYIKSVERLLRMLFISFFNIAASMDLVVLIYANNPQEIYICICNKNLIFHAYR